MDETSRNRSRNKPRQTHVARSGVKADIPRADIPGADISRHDRQPTDPTGGGCRQRNRTSILSSASHTELFFSLEGQDGRRRSPPFAWQVLTIARTAFKSRLAQVTGGRAQSSPALRPKALRRAGVLLALTVFTFLPLPAGAGPGDPLKGEKVFRSCKACHQVGAEARNGIGPHLDGLFGRPAGALDGFKYSGAMKERGASGLVWSEATLDRYLEKPRGYVPGTRMSYRGMANAGERADVIAYLKALSREAPADDPTRAQAERPEIGSAAMHLDGDPDYGEYLASECVTCHQISGRADGIPSIVGWPREAFIRALFEYKSNIRTHQVMQNMTTNLGNEEIAALAAYFGTLDPQ